MPIALDLTGRVALVTGGARGVGRGITERLVEAGAEVVVCGRREPEEPLVATFVAADVRDVEQVEALVDTVMKRFGRLDLAVNNAGGAPYSPAADASPRLSEKVIALNLLGPLHVATAANTRMQTQPDGGSIVNITSVSGMRPSPGTAAYGAAKAGLINLTRSLAMEWAPKVRVNCVTAGMVRTELSHLHYGDDDGIAAVGRTVPLGRIADAGEVGDAVVYLASDRAAYVSGANLVLDGGGERPPFLEAASVNRDES